jgi:outer membrane protein
MKNVNTFLNVVLLIAVVFLLYREFSGAQKNSPSAQAEENLENTDFGQARIAFVNYDTLVARYDYQQELKSTLEAKAKEFEADIAQRSKVFQENVNLLQEKAPTMSAERLQAEQADLQQVQQRLMMYQQQKQQELAQEEQKLIDLLRKEMDDELEKIKQEYNLNFIFSRDRASDLLAADSTYEITTVVLDRLNESYNANKKDNSANAE